MSDQIKSRIRKAFEKNRPVLIRYVKADGTPSCRVIELYDVRISAVGEMYFKALDRDKNQSRSFRLDRIESVSVLRGRISFATKMRLSAETVARLT